MIKPLFLLLAGLLLTACSSTRPLNTTKYATTEEIRFVPIPGKPVMVYQATFKLNTRFSKPCYASVDFENPIAPNRPLQSVYKVPAGSSYLTVESPPFNVVRNDENYQVILRLYSAKDGRTLFAEHRDEVRFKVDPALLKKLGIKSL